MSSAVLASAIISVVVLAAIAFFIVRRGAMSRRGRAALELAVAQGEHIPPSLHPVIDANLCTQRFEEYLTDPEHLVLTAVDEGRIIGYAVLARGVSADVEACVADRPAAELSKMYVLPDWHRSGAAGALLEAGIAWAAAQGMRAMWLGVNQNNPRAQRFYRKHGFEITGTRVFRVGATLENDFLMMRAI